MTSQGPTQDHRSVRLMFAYDGLKVTLQSRQQVAMLAPASHRVDEYENHSGTWIEVRDAEQRVLYRRVLHDIMPSTLEAPSGDPERTFTRVPIKDNRGVFSVVVPDLAQGRTLLLLASPAVARQGSAQVVAKIDLSEGPRSPK
jgi:hypothetical protein